MSDAVPLADIEALIRAVAGTRFTLREHAPLSGGCTHGALRVGDGKQHFFVKHAPHARQAMLAAEKDGLAALRRNGAFRTPEVVVCSATEQHAVLVLEWLELAPVRSDADGQHFAEALMAQHAEQGAFFGWPQDNFIGATPQRNTPCEGWGSFIREQRLRPQLERARDNGYGAELEREGAHLLERLPALFLDYHPRAALLHGDLWCGNAAMTQDGQPAVFDPAVYYGDHEADIAMCELFGGFPSSFYATLHRLAPPAAGHAERKTLYRLYHVLNHLNLFGKSYLGETRRLLARLNDVLGRS